MKPKSPTRQQIATTLADVLPIIERHDGNLNYLKAQADTEAEKVRLLHQRLNPLIASYPHTLRERLYWLMTGRPR